MTIKESTILFEATNMDCAPNINIFRELQVVLDTGYFSGQISPEEDWQQVNTQLHVSPEPGNIDINYATYKSVR